MMGQVLCCFTLHTAFNPRRTLSIIYYYPYSKGEELEGSLRNVNK